MFYSLMATSTLSFLPYCMLGLFTMAEGLMATLLGGAAISGGWLQPLPVFAAVVSGNLSADLAWYTLGHFACFEKLRQSALLKRINPARMEHLKQQVRLHAPRMLFLTKFTVGLPIPTLVAAGMSRVPMRRWILPLAAGELLKSAALISLGYLFAAAIQQTAHTLQIVLWSLTGLAALAGILWWKKAGKGKRASSSHLE